MTLINFWLNSVDKILNYFLFQFFLIIKQFELVNKISQEPLELGS